MTLTSSSEGSLLSGLLCCSQVIIHGTSNCEEAITIACSTPWQEEARSAACEVLLQLLEVIQQMLVELLALATGENLVLCAADCVRQPVPNWSAKSSAYIQSCHQQGPQMPHVAQATIKQSS